MLLRLLRLLRLLILLNRYTLKALHTASYLLLLLTRLRRCSWALGVCETHSRLLCLPVILVHRLLCWRSKV